MQMKIETDYAVRTVLYLCTGKVPCSAEEICTAMQIGREQMEEILPKLLEAGILCKEGAGYSPSRPASTITMLDLLTTMEGSIKINRCLEHDGFCNRNAAGTCPVHCYYSGIQQILEQSLGNTTIADLINGTANAFASLDS